MPGELDFYGNISIKQLIFQKIFLLVFSNNECISVLGVCVEHFDEAIGIDTAIVMDMGEAEFSSLDCNLGKLTNSAGIRFKLNDIAASTAFKSIY